MGIKTVAYIQIKLAEEERSRPIVIWCELNIGSYSKLWDFNFIGTHKELIFEFARKEDATLFALRWAR